MAGQNIGERYLSTVGSLLGRIVETEKENIERAAGLMADHCAADRLIYVYGVGGHSYVGSEEFFFRAGGLANISPMFEASLSLAAGGQKSTLLERQPGIGDKIVTANHLKENDLLIITSAYGINSCTIDAALEAKKRGCTVIAVTSVDFAESTPAGFHVRHASGRNLGDIADVTVNSHIPPGETVLALDGFEQRVGGTCNVLQCFCINWLVARTSEILLERGLKPPVWRSANVPGGDEYNREYLERFTPRVKML